MSIYTRTGDAGESSIKDQRLPKGALVFDVLGDLDELGARLGDLPVFPLRDDIQRALLALGADVAGYTPFQTDLVPRLEAGVDDLMKPVAAPFAFVLPRGPVHVARTVCRRAERALARLGSRPPALAFLNRLSDYLYALAEHGPRVSRTVLVTGGARRIGRAICEELAARGWRVIVHCRRRDDAEAAALAERLGGLALAADLADPLGAARLFQAACDAADDLSALVNNAAVFSTAPALAPDAAAALARVNAEAPEKLTTLLGLRLMEHPPFRGAVVNLLDSRILPPPPSDREETPYEKSKRALAAATRRLAGMMASSLRVNAVAPGPVLAPVAAANREKGGETLLDRRPTPRDVAEAVCFLLEAPSVTGETLAVDAGQACLKEI